MSSVGCYDKRSMVLACCFVLMPLLFCTGLVISKEEANNRQLQDPTQPLSYRVQGDGAVALHLNSILFAPGRKLAIINGRSYSEREQQGGLTVLSIEKDSVVIQQNGRTRRLSLQRNIRR